MSYKLTLGQWLSISPDYRRVEYDALGYPQLRFLKVNADLNTELVPVQIVPVNEAQALAAVVPDHYRDWPMDPRD